MRLHPGDPTGTTFRVTLPHPGQVPGRLLPSPMTLKPLLAFSLLALAARLPAADTVVFGEHHGYLVGPGAPPPGWMDPAQKKLLKACAADFALPAPFEVTDPLVDPPAWGRTAGPRAAGTIRFHPAFAQGFVCHVALEGLLPDHSYILTLNGNPALAGNDLLPLLVPGMDKERYYDFQVVKTDGEGRFDGGFGIYLRKGQYDVRCYVKDTADFKIVLYQDYFPFEVR